MLLKVSHELGLCVARGRDSTHEALAAFAPALDAANVGTRARYAVELVMEETLVNLAWHAFDDDGEHEVRIGLEVEDGALVLRFRDDGKPFDPTSAADPVAPRTLGEAQPGGLGVFLIRKMARSVTYRRNGGANELTVTIARD